MLNSSRKRVGSVKRLTLIGFAVGLIAALFLASDSRIARTIYLTIRSRFQKSEKSRPIDDLTTLDTSSWVKFYDPERAFNGYTLELYRRRVPILIDMNGNILHSWPNLRTAGRARLSQDGRLLLINTDNEIQEVDWNGNLIWRFHNPEERDFPHHDVNWLRNGNVIVICRDDQKKTDYLLEVDRECHIVWEWRSNEFVEEHFDVSELNPDDITHFNSVQEIPPNRWYDQGDKRFKPGNLLVCARNLNTIFIIDRETAAVVWHYIEGMDYPHEALMIERELPGEGNILLFNNGMKNLYHYRRSAILEIDPSERAIAWEYLAEYFYSITGGISQRLPNGNTLISSSTGGRVFEIDSNGSTVWQWCPPYNPMRAQRLPSDYSPRFAWLARMERKPILSGDQAPFIDKTLYTFALEYETKKGTVNRALKNLLQETKHCASLVIPDEASIYLGFGLDLEQLKKKNQSDYSARFVARIKPEGSSDAVILVRKTVYSHQETTWIEIEIPIHDYAYQKVELCLDVEDSLGGRSDEGATLALWAVPIIRSGMVPGLHAGGDIEMLPPEERKYRRQQLKALGYVE